MKGTAGVVSVESEKPESHDEDTQSVGKFPINLDTLQARNLHSFLFLNQLMTIMTTVMASFTIRSLAICQTLKCFQTYWTSQTLHR